MILAALTSTQFAPGYYAACESLRDGLLPLAFVIVAGGFALRAAGFYKNEANPIQWLALVAKITVISAIIAQFPEWVDSLQQGLTNFAMDELGADPTKAHEQFKAIVQSTSPTATGEQSGMLSWFLNTDAQLGEAIAGFFIWAIGWIAWAVQWVMSEIQKVLVTAGSAISPVLLAFYMTQMLSGTATKFTMRMIGLSAWPMAWALASVFTAGLLKAGVDVLGINSLSQGLLTNGIFMIVLATWMIGSSILAPVIINKILHEGSEGLSDFFKAGSSAAFSAANFASKVALIAGTGGAAAPALATAGAAPSVGAGTAAAAPLSGSVTSPPIPAFGDASPLLRDSAARPALPASPPPPSLPGGGPMGALPGPTPSSPEPKPRPKSPPPDPSAIAAAIIEVEQAGSRGGMPYFRPINPAT